MSYTDITQAQQTVRSYGVRCRRWSSQRGALCLHTIAPWLLKDAVILFYCYSTVLLLTYLNKVTIILIIQNCSQSDLFVWINLLKLGIKIQDFFKDLERSPNSAHESDLVNWYGTRGFVIEKGLSVNLYGVNGIVIYWWSLTDLRSDLIIAQLA
jgi:hypothetical protein